MLFLICILYWKELSLLLSFPSRLMGKCSRLYCTMSSGVSTAVRSPAPVPVSIDLHNGCEHEHLRDVRERRMKVDLEASVVAAHVFFPSQPFSGEGRKLLDPVQRLDLRRWLFYIFFSRNQSFSAPWTRDQSRSSWRTRGQWFGTDPRPRRPATRTSVSSIQPLIGWNQP